MPPEAKAHFAAKLAGSLLPSIDAAEMLHVSRQRLHVLIQQGALDATQVGRAWLVTAQSVQALIDERAAQAELEAEMKRQRREKKSGTGA